MVRSSGVGSVYKEACKRKVSAIYKNGWNMPLIVTFCAGVFVYMNANLVMMPAGVF